MPRSFYVLICVQFFSALADNALLIVAIARMVELESAPWLIPMLKLCFVVCYVALAPLVGHMADLWPKGRVMMAANSLKCLAALSLLLGFDPLGVLALAGLGAALYAPAKYGLVTEILPARLLIRANGFIEASAVCAVVLGTALGGLLVSKALIGWTQPNVSRLGLGMACLLGIYVLAAVLNLAIGDNGKRYPHHPLKPWQMFKQFALENKLLWTDRLGGLSMAVTTLLWSIGATLQLIVLRWAGESLGLSLAHAAYLQGLTAMGVIAGAMLASQTIHLDTTPRLLPIGILLGVLIPSMAYVYTVEGAAVLLVLVGGLAGFFVVPMNALLQHRGHDLLTAGKSIAVQGFNENLGILCMLGVYAAATALAVPLMTLIWCFGLLVTGVMCLIWEKHRRHCLQIVIKPSSS
jgi:LPLT family lysophospholipid transporter-like MFS transporter